MVDSFFTVFSRAYHILCTDTTIGSPHIFHLFIRIFVLFMPTDLVYQILFIVQAVMISTEFFAVL